jgi:quercetin dioxygenase-like cupin family protein
MRRSSRCAVRPIERFVCCVPARSCDDVEQVLRILRSRERAALDCALVARELPRFVHFARDPVNRWPEEKQGRDDALQPNHVLVTAVKKSTGALYRIALADPAHFIRVKVSESFIGGDGLLLDNGSVWLIANKTPARAANAAFVLESPDGWLSASVRRTQPLGDAYPTTCAALGGTMYALSSHLGEWLTASADSRLALVRSGRRAEIRAIGTVDASSAASGVRRTLLDRAPAHEPGWETRLYLIEYPPLIAAPLHDHPAIGIGFVIEGEFESAFGDGPTTTVKAGQSFVDQADVPHRLFRNTSADRTLRMLVAYTIRQADEAARSLTGSRVRPNP